MGLYIYLGAIGLIVLATIYNLFRIYQEIKESIEDFDIEVD